MEGWRGDPAGLFREITMTVAFRKVKEKYGWMGNMSPFPVVYKDKTWRTTEALFQALRFDDQAIRDAIHAEKSPMGAKMQAKKHADKMVVHPTSIHDIDNMEMVVRLKLAQYPHLQAELKATGDEMIVEDVTARGSGRHTFWGAALIDGQWIGTNSLGKLWMKLREELKNVSTSL